MRGIEILSGAAAIERADAVSGILRESFETPNQQWSFKSVRDALHVPQTFLVIGDAGCAVLRSVLDEAELLTIAVLPGRRGRGAGQKLLHAVMTAARSADCTSVFLEVASTNQPALSLYRWANFAQIATRKDYYGPGIDALIMHTDLGQEQDR